MMRKLLLVLAVLFAYSQLSAQEIFDDTFGINGRVLTSFGPNESILASIAIQPDGKIVACGSYYDYPSETSIANQLVLSRYNPDGSLDLEFGIAGKVMIPVGTTVENENNNVKVLSDGKILIRTNKNTTPASTTNSDYVLVRCNADGSLDTGFGTNGIVLTDIGNGSDRGWAMEVLSDNSIIIGGRSSALVPNNDSGNFAISKYNPDGSKDLTFGTNGIANINVGSFIDTGLSTDDQVSALKIQADGKILAGGYSSDLSQRAQFALIRLNINGTIDAGFGTNGRVLTDFGNDDSIIHVLQIQEDGKIIAIGTYYYNDDQNEKIIIARYYPNGTLDSTFGTLGKVIINDGNENPVNFAFSSEILADGKLIVTGFSLNETADAIIVRLNIDGTQETAFGNNGIRLIDSGDDEYAQASALQPDGKLVVGGATIFNDLCYFSLWRFTSSNLSANAVSGNKRFSVTPNPFQNFIDVDLKLSMNQEISIDLFDISGRKIANLAQNKFFTEGRNLERIRLSENLPNGIYVVKLSNTQFETSIKIVK